MTSMEPIEIILIIILALFFVVSGAAIIIMKIYREHYILPEIARLRTEIEAERKQAQLREWEHLPSHDLPGGQDDRAFREAVDMLTKKEPKR